MIKQPRPGQTKLLGKPTKTDQQELQLLLSRSPITAPSHLLFQIGRRASTVTTIGRKVKERLMMGRGDAASNYFPDIDLTPFAAMEHGVSRYHAIILRIDKALFVQDTKSRNGTRLNGVQLTSEQAYPLYDGDLLTIGGLPILVWYVLGA